MINELRQRLEQLNNAELDAILLLIDSVKGVASEAKTTAESALELNQEVIIGKGKGKNQSVNYSTLFGNSTDPSINAKTISFLFGSKAFLGYINDAEGGKYTDQNISNDPQGLGQYELVNYRTMINKIKNITTNLPNTFIQKDGDSTSEGSEHTFSTVYFRGLGEKVYYRTDPELAIDDPKHEITNIGMVEEYIAPFTPVITWKSDKLVFGYDVMLNSDTHNYTQYSPAELENEDPDFRMFKTKILGLNNHAKFDNSDPLFQNVYNDFEMHNIPNFDPQIGLHIPSPFEYSLYLEIDVDDTIALGFLSEGTKRVRIPMHNTKDYFNYMVCIDKDGDLIVIMRSTGLVYVPWKKDPISINASDSSNPAFYVVIDAWKY